MGRHVAPRRRWFGKGRTRALMTLGVGLALAVGGTTAYWTDTATVASGTITSGEMDLQVSNNNATWGAVGTAAAHDASHMQVASLTPSESYAFPLWVRNVGAADFTYTASVRQAATTPAWSFDSTAIQVQVLTGVPNTSDVTYPIQQSCGGTAVGSVVPVGAVGVSLFTTARRVNRGSTDVQLCVLVSMATSAANTNQGKQGTIQLDLTATQVTS